MIIRHVDRAKVFHWPFIVVKYPVIQIKLVSAGDALNFHIPLPISETDIVRFRLCVVRLIVGARRDLVRTELGISV